ncbi:iron-sulfur cluster assembly scaffold protein [Candidatus Saccharibacteria bacterium]|nr:iron-sulfur cluster assembly scaffold protein [Candidatus Saccharibacteria bacterium]
MYDRELLDRNLHPTNRGEMRDADVQASLKNASCGDELTVFLRVKNGVIIDGAWEGKACAISQASADLFIDMVRGKKLDELAQTSWLDVPELACVKRMPARVKCAELPWKILENMI